MKGIIIQGSSRSKGNTRKIVTELQKRLAFDFIDLKEKKIGPFDYDFKNQNDDFLPIIRKIANEYDVLVFATPVYWYSMSSIMKTFFDRLSDCLKIEKGTGRKLRGKHLASISCGSDKIEVEGFHVPFLNTAEYLGMHFLGHTHCWIKNDKIPSSVMIKLQYLAKKISSI